MRFALTGAHQPAQPSAPQRNLQVQPAPAEPQGSFAIRWVGTMGCLTGLVGSRGLNAADSLVFVPAGMAPRPVSRTALVSMATYEGGPQDFLTQVLQTSG
jgi:hypothetical protein